MPKRRDTVRLVWLEAFLWISYGVSGSEAAEAIGCNQSNVSRYITKLEDWLGYSLFSSYMPPVLTEDGRKFLSLAIDTVESLNRARSRKMYAEPLWMQTFFKSLRDKL